MPAEETLEREELFWNLYSSYIRCVEVLAMDPTAACDTYGNYNVAAELQIDCGKHAPIDTADIFSPGQVAAIVHLSESLKSLPLEAVSFTSNVQQSYENMRHPAWDKPRAMARELLVLLRPVTHKCNLYFGYDADEA